MLARIKQFFDTSLQVEQPGNADNALQLAAAALLIEVSRADQLQDESEQLAINDLLQKTFNLETEDLSQLVALAEMEAQQATSLYQFTSLIREHYTPEQRFELVKMLWQIAIADGNISKYEDYLIRKVADLIYLPHSEFIRAKLAAIGA